MIFNLRVVIYRVYRTSYVGGMVDRVYSTQQQQQQFYQKRKRFKNVIHSTVYTGSAVAELSTCGTLGIFIGKIQLDKNKIMVIVFFHSKNNC